MFSISSIFMDTQNRASTGLHCLKQDFSLSNIWQKLQEKMNFETFIYLSGSVLRLLFIVFLYIIIRKAFYKFINFLAARFLSHPQKNLNNKESLVAINTILPFIKSFVNFVMFFLFFLLILSELNIDVTPIIYSLSIITLAVSLGSQTLIKDLINGVIALVEGDMKVGDIVTINGYTGSIESISLRCVYLRHGSGALHSIPFSEVKNLINLSLGYNVACIAFYIQKNDDIEIIKKSMEETYDEIKKTHILSILSVVILLFMVLQNL